MTYLHLSLEQETIEQQALDAIRDEAGKKQISIRQDISKGISGWNLDTQRIIFIGQGMKLEAENIGQNG